MSHLKIVAIKDGTLVGAATVNYPELGGVETKTKFYAEGETLTHPSGAVYQQINGDWKLMRYHDGPPAE